jgi:hypothetical protein
MLRALNKISKRTYIASFSINQGQFQTCPRDVMHIIMTYANDEAPPQSMLMMMRHQKPPHATTKIRPKNHLHY